MDHTDTKAAHSQRRLGQVQECYGDTIGMSLGRGIVRHFRHCSLLSSPH